MKLFKYFLVIFLTVFIFNSSQAFAENAKNDIFISKVSNSMIEISNIGEDFQFLKLEIIQNGKILGLIRDGIFLKRSQILFGSEKLDGKLSAEFIFSQPIELKINDRKVDFLCGYSMNCKKKNAPIFENENILIREGFLNNFEISQNDVIFKSGGLADKGQDFCENIQINEILANSNEQFLELKNNSNEIIKLKNCKIEVYLGNNKKPQIYNFTDEEITASGFLTLDSDNDFKFLKTGINRIIFLNSENHEIQKVENSHSKKDSSWIFEGEKWIQSFKITKNSENILQICEDGFKLNSENKCEKVKKTCEEGYFLNEESGRCNKKRDEKSEKICENGYVLNLETNHCNKVLAEKNIAECSDGYYRNTETNRCRKISLASLSKKEVLCAPGYTRNPETNRCRKNISETKRELTPCKDGYERNEETNRCRKIIKNNSEEEGKVEKAGEDSKNTEFVGWWMVVVIILVFLVIMFFEFRKDIFVKFSKGKK